MSQEVKVCNCPCCGSEAYWSKGNRDIRLNDRVQCLECFLEMDGNLEPQSALKAWNMRVPNDEVQFTVYSIDGGKIE